MVDEKMVASKLLTGSLPDPDLMIRSSGEKRVRLWQLLTRMQVYRAGGGEYRILAGGLGWPTRESQYGMCCSQYLDPIKISVV